MWEPDPKGSTLDGAQNDSEDIRRRAAAPRHAPDKP